MTRFFYYFLIFLIAGGLFLSSCTKVVEDEIIPKSAPFFLDSSPSNYLKSKISLAITYDSSKKVDQLDWHRFITEPDKNNDIFRAYTIFMEPGVGVDQISFKTSIYKDALNISLIPVKLDLNGNGNLDEMFIIEYPDSIVFQAHDHKINSNVPFFRFTTGREDGHYLVFLTLWHNTSNNHNIVVFRKSNRLVWKYAKTSDTLIFLDCTVNKVYKLPTGAAFLSNANIIVNDSILILESHAPRNGHTGGGFDDFHYYLVAFRSDASIIWADTLIKREKDESATFYRNIGNGNELFVVTNNSNQKSTNKYLIIDKFTGKLLRQIKLPDLASSFSLPPIEKDNQYYFFYSNGKVLITDKRFNKFSNKQLSFSTSNNNEPLIGEKRLEILKEFEPKVDFNGDGIKDFVVTTKLNQIAILDGKNFSLIAATKPFKSEVAFGIVRTKTENILYVANEGFLIDYRLSPTPLMTRLEPYREIIFGALIVFLFIPFGTWSFFKFFYLNKLYRLLISRSETQGIIIFTKGWKFSKQLRDVELKSINEKACEIIGMPNSKTRHNLSEIPRVLSDMVKDNFGSNEVIERDITFRDNDSKFLSIKIAPIKFFGVVRYKTMTLIDATNLVKAEVLSLAISIAHDAKNELSEVQTRIENLTYKVKDSLGENAVWLQRDESKITESVTEIGETLRRLLFAADMPNPILSKRNMKEILERWITEKGGRYLRRNVKLENLINENLPLINVDERHFGFLLQCACDNAIQAMERNKTDARITFSTYRNDGRLSLIISDNGSGMTKEILEQLKQQYFTTKSDGTGLGMKIIRKVAEEHYADLDIKSVPGKGTDLMIHFNLG